MQLGLHEALARFPHAAKGLIGRAGSALQRPATPMDIAWSKEKTVLSILQDVAHPTSHRRQHRPGESHGFEQDVGEAIVE